MEVLIEQIKVDLYLGFENFEYEGTWNGWDWEVSYEEKNNFIGFYFRNVEEPNVICFFNSTLTHVLEMDFYDFLKWVDSNVHYNSQMEVDGNEQA